MARARNNIARLPETIRRRIAELLDDGATYDEVRADPEVAAELTRRGVELHSTSFGAFRESVEYDEYRRSRRRYGEEMTRRRVAAGLVADGNGADSLARVANFELLRIVLGRLEAGDELESKELAALSRALAPCVRAVGDAEADKFRAQIAERDARIAELTAELAAVKNGGGATGMTPETLADVEDKIKML